MAQLIIILSNDSNLLHRTLKSMNFHLSILHFIHNLQRSSLLWLRNILNQLWRMRSRRSVTLMLHRPPSHQKKNLRWIGVKWRNWSPWGKVFISVFWKHASSFWYYRIRLVKLSFRLESLYIYFNKKIQSILQLESKVLTIYLLNSSHNFLSQVIK